LPMSILQTSAGRTRKARLPLADWTHAGTTTTQAGPRSRGGISRRNQARGVPLASRR
jgi:hypothetical protein